MRIIPTLSLIVGLTVALPVSAATVSAIREATGADSASIAPTVDLFRDDLGTLNPNQPVNFAGGRRQINWDAAPDAVSDPNAFPGDFFNADFEPRARGIEFSTPGDGFQLSSTAASGEPVQFGFDNTFEPFSPERLFTPVGSTTTIVNFFDPATALTTTTTGLGVVFSDVGVPGLTSMSFFDIDGDLLLERDVLTSEGPETFSFLGVAFDAPVVASVEITSGNLIFDGEAFQEFAIGSADAVVMDDFIFGEPAPIPLPASALLLPLGLGALAALRRRRRRHRRG
jgi:hypothetical protein